MKKIFVIGISVYVTGITFLAIKNRLDIANIGMALTDTMNYLTQQNIDAEFVMIIDGLDDPEE